MRQYPDSETLTAYLLGELSDDDAAALEDAYFGDDDLFERVRAAETDLIDAYAAGALSDRRTAAFEQRLMATDEQRERVAFARAMAARVEARPEAPAAATGETWWQRLRAFFGLRGLVVAGAAVAAAVIIGVQVMGAGGGAETAAITLQPTRHRAPTAVATLELSRGADFVEVTLAVDDAARADRYRVALLDEGEGSRTSYDPSAAGTGRVTVTIPAATLDDGRHTFALTDGAGNDLAYYEVVVRRP